MSEYFYICPVCNEEVLLGSHQPNRKMCPQCKINQARAQLLEEHRKRRAHYNAQRNDCLIPVSRPLTDSQLADALFDVSRTEQLKQCQKCRYSAGKGINMFCDFIAHKGHTRQKGAGPGDCRSYEPKSQQEKSKHRKSVTLKY